MEKYFDFGAPKNTKRTSILGVRKFYLFLPLLAIFPSFVRACGSHDEPVQQSVTFFGFGGFFGGVIGALLVVAIILSLMLFNKRGKS